LTWTSRYVEGKRRPSKSRFSFLIVRWCLPISIDRFLHRCVRSRPVDCISHQGTETLLTSDRLLGVGIVSAITTLSYLLQYLLLRPRFFFILSRVEH
ncbi:hypothetical protein LZ31DRAFT_492166, partial [Colletotrichum somersetense]